MINKFGDRRKRQCEYSIESKCSSEFWRDDEWTSSTSKRSKKKDKYNQAKPWETFTKVSQPVELRFSLASLRLTTT